MRPAYRISIFAATVGVLALVLPALGMPANREVFPGRPDALVDLASPEGVKLVKGQWRFRNATIVEVDAKAPGPDLKPSGEPIRTYDLDPKAGAADYDDSGWEVLDPPHLDARRSTGKLCFDWYRIRITIPKRIGRFDPTGSTAVFEIVVDDYAEVWVDGELPRVLGQTGGALVGGFNAPNRLVVARDVKPGQEIQLAILGANGPLSLPPDNFIWIRSATLELYKEERAPLFPTGGEVVRLDPAIDAIVPKEAAIERIADGFEFTEGPVWHPDGYLLFSDPNRNVIYRWTPDGQVFLFRTKSGYSGADIGEYGQPGSNGLTLDREGRLTIAEHGNRRIVRLERNGVVTVLADRFEGERLNSPNDLVYGDDGTLCFSDPPFGLPKFHDDPRRELDFSGVFCLAGETLRLVSRELSGPNGLAFSPDGESLYVGNWDPQRKVILRYDLTKSPARGEVFFDMTTAPGEDALDGVKVDRAGNVYASGPGGLWVFSPAAKHLGTIVPPEHPHNFAFGDTDGKTLYMTARGSLYRVRLGVAGIRSWESR
ncbi:MAG: SMP-30/gluconolactonase/LRE family protein [Candidatus Binatia bacterium]